MKIHIPVSITVLAVTVEVCNNPEERVTTLPSTLAPTLNVAAVATKVLPGKLSGKNTVDGSTWYWRTVARSEGVEVICAKSSGRVSFKAVKAASRSQVRRVVRHTGWRKESIPAGRGQEFKNFRR
jgi:hypothetical protein